MKKRITKAIIPAAGLGTRFLPQTKAMPKEMLPMIDKPIVQHVVEEAVAAGITDIIIVTGPHKRSIEDHFDRQYELEKKLQESGKQKESDSIQHIAEMANFIYIRQKGHYGNGTPILNAAHLVSGEPFLVLWADDFVVSKVPRAKQLIDAYHELSSPVIALIPIQPEDSQKYGVPGIKKQVTDDIFQLDRLVEKPQPSQAPSNYGSVGGYVLTPYIIDILSQQPPDKSGEIYLSKAIDVLAREGQVYGKVIEGTWHDTGNKEKYLEAVVDVALKDPQIGPGFKKYLEKRLKPSA